MTEHQRIATGNTGENEFIQFIALTLDLSQKGLLNDMIYRSNLRHDFFIFAVMIEGSGAVKINLKEFALKKNDLLIIPPDATKEHIYLSDDAVIKVVAYTSSFLFPLQLPENFWEMTDYFSAKNIPIWSLQQEEALLLVKLIAAMEQHLQVMKTHPFGTEILNHIFMIFILQLGNLSRVYSQPGNQRYTRKETLTIQFHRLAKKHFRQQRSVIHYAGLLFVTPKYLTETIKEVSGKTAGDVIDSFTVQEARIQLTNSTRSVSEIASELHFSDQSAFGKFFKRNTGFSPTEYRNLR